MPGNYRGVRNTLVALSLSMLVGCATWQGVREGLDTLMYQRVDKVVQQIGYPDGERTIAGKHLLYWADQRSGAVVVPQTQTATGYVGTSPVTIYQQTSQVVPYNYQCLLTLEIDDTDRVSNWAIEGNLGACGRYAKLGRNATRQRASDDADDLGAFELK